MSIFDNYLLDILRDLHHTDLMKLNGLIKTVNLKKNDILLKNGTFSPYVFYIKTGLIRGYLYDENGDEKTIFFRWQKEFGADPNCFFEKKPAKLTWEALEETTILQINTSNIEEMSKRNIGLLKLRIDLQKKLLKRMFERIEDFLMYSHEERFRMYLHSYPDLCERVPDKHLASFLGITPVSLSRIKKRIDDIHHKNNGN